MNSYVSHPPKPLLTLIGELKKSLQQGQPTEMVKSLLQDLAAKIKVDTRADLSGLDVIDRVVQDPSVLWRKHFFTTLFSLEQDQQEVVLSWFEQMTKLQEMYVGEICSANNYLKQQVCRAFAELHISDKVKFDFIERVSTLENKPYFQKKLSTLDVQTQLVLSDKPATEGRQERTADQDKKLVKEVRFAKETEKLIRSYNFFDDISTSCSTTARAK